MSTRPHQGPSVAGEQTMILPSYGNAGGSTETATTRATYKKTLPAGQPYLAKVNGRLVLARDKSSRPKYSLNLLGEAFGVTTKVIHKRSKSVEKPPKTPIIINGITYVPQLPQAPYTAPVSQGPFPGALQPVHYHQPQSYVAPKPTEKDFKQLRRIDAHFHKTVAAEPGKATGESRAPKVVEVKTTITITKHICANCGRVRSAKYQHENPIKPGETPAPAFCRKCQRDASSTSCSDSEDERAKRKAKKTTKSKKKGKKHKKKKLVESSSEDEDEPQESSEPKSSNKAKQRESSKDSKRKSSEERILVAEDIIEGGNRQGRGRTRRRTVVEDAIDTDTRPTTPPKKFSGNASQATAADQKDEDQRDHELPPKLPPKIRETCPEQSQQHSPPIQYRIFEAVPIYHHDDSRPREVPVHFVEKSFFDQHNEPVVSSQEYVKSYERLPPKSRSRPGRVYTVDGSDTVRSMGSRGHNFAEREFAKTTHSPTEVRDFAEHEPVQRSHFPSDTFEVREPYVEESAKKRHSADNLNSSVRERDTGKKHSFDDLHSSSRRSHYTAERNEIKRASSDPTHRGYSNQVYEHKSGANAGSFQSNARRHHSRRKRAPPPSEFVGPTFEEFTDGLARDNVKTADREHFQNLPRECDRHETARKKQEYVDRVNLDAHNNDENIEREHSVNYFNEDWTTAEPTSFPEKPRHSRQYRRENYEDAELGNSDVEREYSRTAPDVPPRAPSPPPAIDSEIEISRQPDLELQVVRSSHRSKSKVVDPPSTTYEVSEPHSRIPSRSAYRSRSSARNHQHNHRASYAYSPSRSSGYASYEEYEEYEAPFSNLRENERRAEYLAEQNMESWNRPFEAGGGWMTMTQTELDRVEARVAAEREIPGFNDHDQGRPGYGWRHAGGNDDW